jgi:uncharacterized protein YndB with AHSA1/START domain
MRLLTPICAFIILVAATAAMSQEKSKKELTSVSNSVSIAGPLEPVFDLVTSARYWSKWHPASKEVRGVTERPYRLGDVIHERVNFGGKDIVATWKVVEHKRPHRIVLQSQNYATRIVYTFEPKGELVQFRRDLQYDEAELAKLVPNVGEVRKQMHNQSEEGLKRLKDLVETIVRAEGKGF